ncbi:shikimate dehydrogenase family protein [Actibacterium ureilyticum]|uniref:shikimate dehydrogenase family protein n=1 Tax=Actibacterium ureilyticum TaxID=1590614 RepID=UPI000BAAA096|nr:shikimate dehydrogenase [Actibacterium ureilyticum]
MQLSGETTLYPIVGHPIAQVRSPRFLTEIFDRRGINAIVPPVNVRPENIHSTLDAFRKMENVGGIVVTLPHKIDALQSCDVVSERAKFVGSVNVIHKDADGRYIADNVDGLGYMDGVKALGFDVADKRALLVGVGGAGSAVAYEILARGAAHLKIAEIDTARRDATIAALDARYPGKVGIGSDDPTGVDFIANVTPCGMREGDPFPADPTKMNADQFVADSITKPAVTPMLQAARNLGCRTMAGAGMFDAEAERLVDFLLGEGLPAQ